MKRAAGVLAATLLALGCRHGDATLPPLGQLLLYLDTDAPLPPPPGETLGVEDPAPLFDRVRVEVYRPGDAAPCAECTREFALDRSLVASGRASVGISPPPGVSGYVARVRMFRAAFVELGQPREDASVDVTVALPPIATEGITEVTAVLHTDDVGRPVGSRAAPALPQIGRAKGLAGSWPPAKPKPCVGEPADGEVCVPGGAFWAANPLAMAPIDSEDPLVLHIASVPPFFLDATEVTVAAFRRANVARTNDPMPFRDNDGAPGPALHCTYTQRPANDELLPVVCVSWDTARAYCASRGADLPTESQLSFAAGARRGRLFVWGEDPPSCDDAVFLRVSGFALPEATCPGTWMRAPASGLRDRLDLPGGTIWDLAGNVAEYTRDTWNRLTEPCWGRGAFVDPLCTQPGRDGGHTVVGGSWVEGAASLASTMRRPSYDFATAQAAGPAGGFGAPQVTSIGFRCARPATP